jgi:signal transduction histidine kinase
VPVSLKLLKTSTFRLAALYLLLFALSTAAILGYVYWYTARLIERQTDQTIVAEINGLSDHYRMRGVAGVAETIRRRGQDGSGALYLLSAPSGERVIGNIDALPEQAVTMPAPGFIDFPFNVWRGPLQEPHLARAYHVELSGGYDLVVGRDVESLRLFRVIIRNTIVWALGGALVLGLGGGMLMSRRFLRRVDRITEASRAIMAGDLSGRMPVGGANDELDRLARSLNEMLDQIERLMRGMREVSLNVAHDLRTPLTRLKARVEAALRSPDAAEQRAALERTNDEADRLLQTFNSLLSIARAESGQLSEGLKSIDAKQVIEDVAELYVPIAEEAGGTLRVEAAPGLAVRAGRQLLAQAISNLIDNALKYGVGDGEAPAIALTGRLSENGVEIAVADRGPGIPEADRERVKDRFVRLDASRSKPGNGLGLSLAASVIKLHGGTLALEDNAPGLRAVLRLPVDR